MPDQDWVFTNPCGCPIGVLVADRAPTLSKAWKGFFATQAERDRAMDRGVTVELMSHDRYVVEVSPKMGADYTCPHAAAGATS